MGHAILPTLVFSAYMGAKIRQGFYQCQSEDQVLQRRGFKVRVWLKSARIQYIKPGRTNLYFNIRISEEEIAEAEHILNTVGKFVKEFPIEMYDKNGELCVSIINEVYVRNLHAGEKRKIAY